MDFRQLQEEFRKLEAETGKKTAEAIIAIMELRATKFEEDLQQFRTQVEKDLQQIRTQSEKYLRQVDQRFNSIRWMIGIAFTVLGILMVLLKVF